MPIVSRRPTVVRLAFAGLFALTTLSSAACSSDSKSTTLASSTSPAPTTGPVYATEGPHKVGYTTLHLPDRDVSVWYPADEATVAGKPKATYDQTTPLPDDLKGVVPAEFNRVVEMNAYADVPADSSGPFPVVLFSHGLSAYRLLNSALDVGLASWGFVVVAPDYLEHGLVAQVKGTLVANTAEIDHSTATQTLDLIDAENRRSGSLLHGVADTTRVAAVGHSLGGRTSFDILNDPRVAVAVAWAPVAPSGVPANKPTMIIGAGGDIALTPETLGDEYASFPAPKRFVEIGGTAAGHNTFTDICAVIRDGGGLLAFAQQNHLVSDGLIKLGQNGCAPTDMAPDRFQSVVQHFTVAELRSAFGIDPQPVGLDDSITTAFGDIPVEYQHTP
jgi:dienelactone hydrolase